MKVKDLKQEMQENEQSCRCTVRDIWEYLQEAERMTSTGVMLRSVPNSSVKKTPAVAQGTKKIEVPKRDVEPMPVLRLGTPVERNGVRFKRWKPALEVTNLENAGKRGKTVEYFYIDNMDYSATPEEAKKIEDLERFIVQKSKSYKQALVVAKNTIIDWHLKIKLKEGTKKGIDVEPAMGQAGSRIEIKTDEFILTASMKDFSIHQIAKGLEDTEAVIPPVRGSKMTAIKQFYGWVRENESQIKTWSYRTLRKKMSDAKLNYHSFSTYD